MSKQAEDDTDYVRFLGSDDDWGCLFPERCLMPGLHFTDECHTAEMYEAYIESEREQHD